MLPTPIADEQSQNRIASRRTWWWIHLLGTVIAVFVILGALTQYNAAYHSWLSTNSPWLLAMIVILFAAHTIHFVFREAFDRGFNRGFQKGQYESLLEREGEQKRKRPYTEPNLVYLSDDGELVDYDEELDDAYPPRHKRG